MEKVRLEIVPADHEDLASLIHKLDEDLLERYPPEEIFGLDFNDPKVNEMLFIVAYYADEPAGCGAMRSLDGEMAELKRFFVDGAFRQQGIAARILAEIEKNAVQSGFRKMRLEAGEAQPEAVKFYSKHGFYRIEKYGEYLDCPTSVCFEKELQRP